MTGGGLAGRCARCLLELAVEDSQQAELTSAETIASAGLPVGWVGFTRPSSLVGGTASCVYWVVAVRGRCGTPSM